MFVVLVTPALPDHLRGYISRFLVETHPNIFIGKCSARVRDNLWERVTGEPKADNLMLIFSNNQTEQGFTIQTHGNNAPKLVDFDNLQLVERHIVAENTTFRD